MQWDELDQQPCSVARTLSVIGDRWTLLILRDVIVYDRRHFRALLLGSAEGIATNILTDRLVKLVDAGILTPTADHRQGPFWHATDLLAAIDRFAARAASGETA